GSGLSGPTSTYFPSELRNARVLTPPPSSFWACAWAWASPREPDRGRGRAPRLRMCSLGTHRPPPDVPALQEGRPQRQPGLGPSSGVRVADRDGSRNEKLRADDRSVVHVQAANRVGE